MRQPTRGRQQCLVVCGETGSMSMQRSFWGVEGEMSYGHFRDSIQAKGNEKVYIPARGYNQTLIHLT